MKRGWVVRHTHQIDFYHYVCKKSAYSHNVTGEKSEEVMYYVSSLKDVELIAETARSH